MEPGPGVLKLSQDLATLVNRRCDSDIQFKVGGNTSTLQENEEESTLYAHSIILRCRSRYFATMLDQDKNWKESTNRIIYKPNISPSIFKKVLYYIYTGDVGADSVENTIELVKAAEEMELEELSDQCQTKLMHIIRYIFPPLKIYKKNENEELLEGPINHPIPVNTAVRTYVIPILNLANTHSLEKLSQKLIEIISSNISVITRSPNAYATFVDGISIETLSEIIQSDRLTVGTVWGLILKWGCHQTNLSEKDVLARLKSIHCGKDDAEDLSDGKLVNFSQLNLLKENIEPLLPFIPIKLEDSQDYWKITYILSYFLPGPQFSSLALFYLNPQSWNFLINSLNRMSDRRYYDHFGFKVLFRASEHGFLASAFHESCDEKGPTLVLVKSEDGHIFGGVNFNHWRSNNTYSPSTENFLFALPDGRHRKRSVIFPLNENSSASYNYPSFGPTFGSGYDLCIVNGANTNRHSYSNMPASYTGEGASNTALAGAHHFKISEYIVFSI